MAKKPVRYLLVGGWNTVFGYCAAVGLYYILSPALHIIVISALANILAISMSFATYKVFVFRTTGNWWREYARSYVVYGSAAVIGTVILWLLVDVFHIRIWLAQAGTMGAVVVLSYFAHDRFTFRLKAGGKSVTHKSEN